MIRLMVEDYCQECQRFDPVCNKQIFHIGGTAIPGNTVVTCVNREECEKKYKGEKDMIACEKCKGKGVVGVGPNIRGIKKCEACNGTGLTRGYWDNVCDIQKKQTEKGIATYGQTLEQNKSLTPVERLTYLEEELIDGLMYIEHIKAMFEEGK